jgi:hypothetical protein
MKKTIEKIICATFVVVFVYTGVDKLWDHSKFETQLGFSPFMFPVLDTFLSWSIPILLLHTAILLLFDHPYKVSGIGLCGLLIAIFTIYVIAILTIAPFVPCSCIGISDRFTWHQQLYINIFLLILVGVYLYLNRDYYKYQRTQARLRAKRQRAKRKIFVATTRDKP